MAAPNGWGAGSRGTLRDWRFRKNFGVEPPMYWAGAGARPLARESDGIDGIGSGQPSPSLVPWMGEFSQKKRLGGVLKSFWRRPKSFFPKPLSDNRGRRIFGNARGMLGWRRAAPRIGGGRIFPPRCR